MKKILSILVVAAMLCTMLPMTVFAATSGDWTYEIVDEEAKTAQITKYRGSSYEIELPAELDGYTIVSVAAGALATQRSFLGQNTVSPVAMFVPTTVTSFEDGIFNSRGGATETVAHIFYEGTSEEWDAVEKGNNNVFKKSVIHKEATEERYTLKETAPTCTENGYTEYFCAYCALNENVDYPALYTINGDEKTGHDYVDGVCTNCEALEISYEVISEKDKTIALKVWNSNNYEAIVPNEIDGYTVTEISENAFSNCTNLVVLTLPRSIKTIGASAFFTTTNLTHVFYAGTETAWSEISIGKNNTVLTGYIFPGLDTQFPGLATQATIHYEADENSYEVTDVEATCMENAKTVYTCILCTGEENAQPVVITEIEIEGTKTGHSVVDGKSNNDATCTKNGTITGVCEYCEEKVTVEDENSIVPHKFQNYVKDNNATCKEDGTLTSVCEYGCGTENSIVDEGTMVEHVYTNYVNDNNATCTQDGTLTANCDYDCGTTHTITNSGSKLDHTFVNGTCSACGEKEETTDDNTGDENNSKLVLKEDSLLSIKEDALLVDVAIGSAPQEIISNFEQNEGIRVVDTEGNLADNKVGTGYKIQLVIDEIVVDELVLIIDGDVDGSGDISTKDVTLIRRYIAKWDIEINLEAADVNDDSNVATKDSTLVRRYIANWDVEL